MFIRTALQLLLKFTLPLQEVCLLSLMLRADMRESDSPILERMLCLIEQGFNLMTLPLKLFKVFLCLLLSPLRFLLVVIKHTPRALDLIVQQLVSRRRFIPVLHKLVKGPCPLALRLRTLSLNLPFHLFCKLVLRLPYDVITLQRSALSRDHFSLVLGTRDISHGFCEAVLECSYLSLHLRDLLSLGGGHGHQLPLIALLAILELLVTLLLCLHA